MAGKKPNIIFMCSDQQRKDTLSCYRPGTKCSTPNLDSLAEEGVVFDSAYCSCPVCTPARSSMQTGLMPSKSGFEGNSFQTGVRCHEIHDNPKLLSRRLIAEGYTPLYTGKWHLGFGRDKSATAEGRSLLRALEEENEYDIAAYVDHGDMPTDVGYRGDDFAGHGDGGWAYPQFRKWLEDSGKTLVLEKAPIRRRPGDHSFWGEVKSGPDTTIERFLVERAEELIESALAEDRPFFLNLNFWGPHEPYFAPTEFLDLYRDMEIPPHRSFSEDPADMPLIYNQTRRPEVGWDFYQNTLRHYWACMSHIDSEAGRLFAWLKEKGLWDDTLIIWAADHGDYQGAHGGLENKGYGMYEEITGIPLIMKCPKDWNVAPGRRPHLVGTCDINATILAAAGFSGDTFDGRNLLPVIEGKVSVTDGWDEIVTEGMGANNIVCTQRMYRVGWLKYVFNSGGEEQLFDLSSDPDEMKNLAKTEPELLSGVRERFAFWMEERKDPIRHAYQKIFRIGIWSGK